MVRANVPSKLRCYWLPGLQCPIDQGYCISRLRRYGSAIAGIKRQLSFQYGAFQSDQDLSPSTDIGKRLDS